VNEGDYCGYCEINNVWKLYDCDNDHACTLAVQGDTTPKCVPVHQIDESCGGFAEVCREAPYTVLCIAKSDSSTVCGGKAVRGPTDACTPNSASPVEQGDGCFTGRCSSSNQCPGAKEGEACTTQYCAGGLYCSSGVCTARSTLGSSCTVGTPSFDEKNNGGCPSNAECVDGTCVEIYSVVAGGKCGSSSSVFYQDVCEKGLLCKYLDDQTCGTVTDGQDCDLNSATSGTCGNYQACVCDGNGKGTCRAGYNFLGPKARALAQCMADNKCFGLLTYFTEGCIHDNCDAQAQAAYDEARTASGASMMSAVAAALLLLLAVLLA